MDEISKTAGWILWIIAIGVSTYVVYKLKKGEKAEQELLTRDYKEEKNEIEKTNAGLTDQQLADKNNKRFGD